MGWFNWCDEYRRRPVVSSEELLAAVEKVERQYWPWLVFGTAVHLLGLYVMAASAWSSTNGLIVGAFLALDGSILVATLKIVAHIRLQGLRIMLQTENRIQQELRQMDATEL